MSENVQVVITGEDKASPAIKQASASLGGLAGASGMAMTALKAFVPYLTGAAIIAGMTKMVSAAAEEELMFKRLETAVNLTGASYAESKTSIDAFIASMQRTTAFGDSDMAPAIQEITQMTGDLNKGFQGARLAADMASTGLFDISTASRMVSMAFEGQTMMLGRYIPELKDSAMTAKGLKTEEEKAAYAIQVLTDKFGGQAQQNVKTFAGSTKQLTYELGDLIENAGAPFLDLLGNVASGLTNVVRGMNDWATGADAVSQSIGGTMAALQSQDLATLSAQLTKTKFDYYSLKFEVSDLWNKIQEIKSKTVTTVLDDLVGKEADYKEKKRLLDSLTSQIELLNNAIGGAKASAKTPPKTLLDPDELKRIKKEAEDLQIAINSIVRVPPYDERAWDKVIGKIKELSPGEFEQQFYPDINDFISPLPSEYWGDYGQDAGQDFSLNFKDATQSGLTAGFSAVMEPLFSKMGKRMGDSFGAQFAAAFLQELSAQMASKLAFEILKWVGGFFLSTGSSGISTVRGGSSSIDKIRLGLNDQSNSRRSVL